MRSERAKDAEKAEKDYLNSCVRDALLWLGVTNPTNTQEDSLETLSKEPDEMDNQWILCEQSVALWLQRNKDCLTLWLNGKPGAGELHYCINSDG